MVNSCAVCGCCTRTDIVREHLEDTLRICDVSAKGLYITRPKRLDTSKRSHAILLVLQFIVLQISCSLRSVHYLWLGGGGGVKSYGAGFLLFGGHQSLRSN